MLSSMSVAVYHVATRDNLVLELFLAVLGDVEKSCVLALYP